MQMQMMMSEQLVDLSCPALERYLMKVEGERKILRDSDD
jgi:hypothetical protein